MNQSKRSLYIKFLNDLPQMLIKIQRNASKELFKVLKMNGQSQLKVKCYGLEKKKKLLKAGLKGITTKITKECNALCHDVITKH